ncbi:alpha/beta hydrolase family protein [Pontibacter harenae]|uniref:alpha/beta hydrolase family protein n=1 Tax=Pontibacter harenae TaxID=2894083 RepID=UPI001E4C99BF|nr:alpha/beta fold hydrolase [Pontibacter harenae]MCC9165980.1 prolyl oligopeptidase family serine peptidase [Pontibacter harenae]
MKRTNIILSSPIRLLISISVLVTVSFSSCRENKNFPIPPIERMQEYTTSKQYPATFAAESIEEWRKQIPEVQNIAIKSTADGQVDSALYFASESDRKKPLLVVLHSWSSEFLQEVSLPYAHWAKKYDWAFIQPNYRGAFETPEAMASDVAIQDIVDAVHYAMEHDHIDSSRVYLVGSSGGAMTALVAASRHPELWAGVMAWVPVFDIVDWYQFNLNYPHRHYNDQICAALGGEPLPDTEVAKEAKQRSPSTQIHQAKDVPIFLAHGINDLLVPPSHSIRAFNILAAPEDTISQEQMDYIVAEQALPPGLDSTATDKYFAQGDPPVVFERSSNNVKLILYKGVHDMAYNPSLLWLNDQRKRQ